MTTQDRSHLAAHGHHEAEIVRIEHVLTSFGTLTRGTLRDLCGATAWRDDSFDVVLHDAVAAGRIRQLTPELYSVPEDGDGGA
jgi:hypothetical protein